MREEKRKEQNKVCFQDHPTKKHIAIAAAKFSNDERCAQYRSSEIVAGSCGASHTNHWVACVHDERPCDNPKFACDGKIDKARLYTNADFKKKLSFNFLQIPKPQNPC